jgi:hypothetical protein
LHVATIRPHIPGRSRDVWNSNPRRLLAAAVLKIEESIDEAAHRVVFEPFRSATYGGPWRLA